MRKQATFAGLCLTLFTLFALHGCSAPGDRQVTRQNCEDAHAVAVAACGLYADPEARERCLSHAALGRAACELWASLATEPTGPGNRSSDPRLDRLAEADRLIHDGKLSWDEVHDYVFAGGAQ